MRYRHAFVEKTHSGLYLRFVVDRGDYRGRHRNCTCPVDQDARIRWGLPILVKEGCPSHGDGSDEVSDE